MIKKLILILLALTVSGCSSFGYYMDLMAGHSELLEQRKPVAEIIADKKTSKNLRQLLKTSQNIRDFATDELDLPENESYRQYADLKRRYAVWNVIAAEEFSIQPKKWCFLLVGCLSYRGYFSKQVAVDYASGLKKQGYDVYVAGASAYSTLGWFDDPLLNTMMVKSEAQRAGIIFHELAHQVVYIDNDSAFNEAFATTVEEEGIRRWLQKKGKKNNYINYLIDKNRDVQLNQLLQRTRDKLKQCYKKEMNDENKKQEKKQIFSLMKKDYQILKKNWGGYNKYDKWMQQDLNNAHLSLIATYHSLVPKFKTLLKQENNNLKKFYVVVETLGELEKEARNKKVNKLIYID